MSTLPPYSVRVSSRAKRLQLKVMPPGKVEVVVPKRFNVNKVPAFVAEHRHWLQRHLDKMAAVYVDEPLLPEVIHLPAIAKQWQLEYREGLRARVIALGENKLKLHAPSKQHACPVLQDWLQQRAKQILPPWLEQVSAEAGLEFNRVTVRAQRTRWGSCSARKNINLNRALLFVSPEAVRYLLIHELCHTVHMNHSPQYWRLVASLMPEYKQMEAELRHVMAKIPRWALPNFGPC